MQHPKPRFHYYATALIIISLTAYISILLQTSSKNVAENILIGMTLLTSGFCVFELMNVFRYRTRHAPSIFYIVALLVMMGSSIIGTVLLIIPETEILRNIRGVNLLFSSLSILMVTRTRQKPPQNS